MAAPEVEEPEGMVMTPMIDVTFQMLIFFLLVTDMARQQLEDVKLPWATKGVKAKVEDPNTLVLNILPDGTIKLSGKILFRSDPLNPSKQDVQRLADLFESRKQQEKYQKVKGSIEEVNYPLLIRADRSTPSQYLQLVLMVASLRGAVTDFRLGAQQISGGP